MLFSEIPSVKDLEAQMTKVDLRPEYTIAKSMTSAHQPIQIQRDTDQVEKPVSRDRDTEAFKRLLQQLGSQNNAQSAAYTTNISPVRSEPNAHDHRYQQHMIRGGQDSHLKKDDLQSYQQRAVKNESMPYNRHNETILHNQLHPALIPCVHDPNLSGPGPAPAPLSLQQQQSQKRIEVQHLFQSK